MTQWEALPALVGALGAGVAAILGVLRFFDERRERRAVVRQAFAAVVAALAEPNPVQRLAAAILLRRFFDPATEVGAGFTKEAVDVIASLLREEPEGNLQKVLADGLAYAPSLAEADLQKTNLRGAYLGVRGGEAPAKSIVLDGADLYRADLTGASLKNVRARGAQFYEARLVRTVLRGADLRGANFYGADLAGARLDVARLEGASFRAAVNLPAGLVDALAADGTYGGVEPFRAASAPASVAVFLSRPGAMAAASAAWLRGLRDELVAAGFEVVTLDRSDYPASGPLTRIRERMAPCAGAVVVALRDVAIAEGVWRPGTADSRSLVGTALPTPWTQLELGMAFMRELPVLLAVEPGARGGALELGGAEPDVVTVTVGAPIDERVFARWAEAVRQRTLSPRRFV